MNDEEIVVENNELVIDQSNFDQYFFDVRTHKPQRGQVLARYTASAEFVDGRLKKDVIDLIYNRDKAEAATRVMRKLGFATEREALRVCKELAKDLAVGMTPQEVEEKIYKYQVEVFYYTQKEYVPTDDPHWSIISLTNLDEFLDAAGQKINIKGKVVDQDEKEASDDSQDS